MFRKESRKLQTHGARAEPEGSHAAAEDEKNEDAVQGFRDNGDRGGA